MGDSLKLSRALGYDLNAVELVVGKEGVEEGVFVVDANNPVPDMHGAALGDRCFEDVVNWLVALIARRARSPERTIDRYAWSREIDRG